MWSNNRYLVVIFISKVVYQHYVEEKRAQKQVIVLSVSFEVEEELFMNRWTATQLQMLALQQQ